MNTGADDKLSGLHLESESRHAASRGLLIAHGAAHGSLGELWQGPVRHQGVWRLGLVTLPALRHSYASFYAAEPGADYAGQEVPAKRRAAMRIFLESQDAKLPAGWWEFASELPVGKGMSSSTADILAVLRCLNMIFKKPEDHAATQRILSAIERSDAIHIDRYCLYLSGAHVAVRSYPAHLAYNVCYAYDDCEVLTDDFPESYLLDRYREAAGDYAASLRRLDAALTGRDPSAAAREATCSAELAQAYLPSALVGALLRDHRDLGAVGVVRAHTGTVTGLLSAGGFDSGRRAELCQYFLSHGYRCYFTRVGYPLV